MKIKRESTFHAIISIWGFLIILSCLLPIADAGNLRGFANSIGISSTGETLKLTDDDSIEFYAKEYRKGYISNEYFEERLLWSREENEVDDDYVKSL